MSTILTRRRLTDVYHYLSRYIIFDYLPRIEFSDLPRFR